MLTALVGCGHLDIGRGTREDEALRSLAGLTLMTLRYFWVYRMRGGGRVEFTPLLSITIGVGQYHGETGG